MSECVSAPLEKHFGGRAYLIREVTPDDAPEVLRLFLEIFGQQPGPDWFAWKYGDGGSGALGLWDESGRLMAHYAGIARTVSWQGKAVVAVQIGDVMVSPGLRGLVLRKGPFQQLCSRFFASRVGAGRPYRFAWGFPNQRALRLGVTLGLYRDEGVISQLSWPARPGRLPFWWSFAPLADSAEDFDAGVEAVWRAMAEDMKGHVLGVRDAGYLRWRYIDRPDRGYRLFALRRRLSGKTLAVVAMRLADGSAELLDVVGPRGIFAVAVRAAAIEAARTGAQRLSAWASPALAEFARDTGAEASPSGASLAIGKESDFSDDEVAAARWWLMGGDTDFL